MSVVGGWWSAARRRGERMCVSRLLEGLGIVQPLFKSNTHGITNTEQPYLLCHHVCNAKHMQVFDSTTSISAQSSLGGNAVSTDSRSGHSWRLQGFASVNSASGQLHCASMASVLEHTGVERERAGAGWWWWWVCCCVLASKLPHCRLHCGHSIVSYTACVGLSHALLFKVACNATHACMQLTMWLRRGRCKLHQQTKHGQLLIVLCRAVLCVRVLQRSPRLLMRRGGGSTGAFLR